MRFFKKTTSILLILAFLATNVLYAEDLNAFKAFKLAPISRFTRMQGIEFKDAAQIELHVRLLLNDNRQRLTAFNQETLRAIGEKPIEEDSIFSKKVTGKLFFDKTRQIRIDRKIIHTDDASYIVEARVNDVETGAYGNIYYCLISSTFEAPGQFKVSVVPERIIREVMAGGDIKFTHDSIDAADREILNTYSEHEASSEKNKAIDEWIAEHMMRGEYMVDNFAAGFQKDIYSHVGRDLYNVRNYTAAIDNIERYLKVIGLSEVSIFGIKQKMLQVPLVLIAIDAGEPMPTVTIDGKPIEITAHSSEFATYIFVPRYLYDEITSTGRWDVKVSRYIEETLVHEIGARCGLRVRVDGEDLRDALDDAYSLYLAAGSPGAYTIEDPRISAELSHLAPVNLLHLQDRNDYAAGKIDTLKSLFSGAMFSALAGIVTLNTVACTPQSPVAHQLPSPTTPQLPPTQATPVPTGTQAPLTPTPTESQSPAATLTPTPAPQSPSDYEFARKYTVAEVVRDPIKAEAFIKDYMTRESEYFKIARQEGVAMDGWSIDPQTLEPTTPRPWTAMSKECQDIAVQIKIQSGNKYGVILSGAGDAASARQIAVAISRERIDAYEQFNRDYPVFGGFQPWIKAVSGRTTLNTGGISAEREKSIERYRQYMLYKRSIGDYSSVSGLSQMMVQSIMPTSDWSNRVAALDVFEWIWSLYTEYHVLRKIGQTELAARYENYFNMLMRNAVTVFWDPALHKIRAEVRIIDPTATTVYAANYVNNVPGYYLDDTNEGIMAAYAFELFTNLPQAEKERIWQDIKMVKVSTAWGDTYKGWPESAQPDGSPHTKWPTMYLPITDNPIAKKVFFNQEMIRTHLNEYGIPVSTNTPGGGGYTAYDPNVFAPYGASWMILLSALNGDVTVNNYGLAWLLNMLQVDKMQGPKGSGESFSIKPGTNELDKVSFLLTVDGKENAYLGMMGGIVDETREALEGDGLDDRFMARVDTEYTEAFGSAASVASTGEFLLPKDIKSAYKPTVSAPMEKGADLINIWQYPSHDKWGEKAVGETITLPDGRKAVKITYTGAGNGWGWAGGSLVPSLAPAQGSSVYFRGTGSFTLKLEGEKLGQRVVFTKPVKLSGEGVSTKVLLDGSAVGATFTVMVIDQILGDVQITDMVYAPGVNQSANTDALRSVASIDPAAARGERYQRHQIDKISEVLWRAGTGIIPPQTAKEQLALLAPRVGNTPSERDAAYGAWLGFAGSLLAKMGRRRYKMPSDSDITAIAGRIKEMGIEVFVPRSQIKASSQSAIRRTLSGIFGDSIRIYDTPGDLEGMMRDPNRAIVMTTDLGADAVNILQGIESKIKGARFMNFEKMDIVALSDETYEDYIAETLSILLVARAITTNEAKDPNSESYKLLAHLVERHLGNEAGVAEMEAYISAVTDDSMDLAKRLSDIVKIVLRAMPIEEYKAVRPAVQVLWSA